MRRGEMIALEWSDIDFENNLLKINKTYNRINGQDVITSPKTETSNRIINIPDFLKNSKR